jgi:cyclopropane-fatty-acyl-phospholipid synthase
MTLEQASVQKLERICRKLELRPQEHVLEIGTGWGGCALHMARNYGCRVTTTTISEQQYLLAKERVAAAGLSDRITVLLADYRSLTGQYDKIVSIEMLEAVGEKFLPTYFRACHRLLNPGGRLLVQVITMPDHRYDVYRSSVDFIQKYIFPGGHLPSIGAMQQAIGGTANLQLIDAFQFPESYAQTLWHWRQKFWERIAQVRELGFDERFIRMWDYYFAYCEAAFRERAVSVGQFLWERPRY